MRICPEGWYFQHKIMCYVTFSSTFTGSDSFTYVAVDEYGLESAPANVTITVFQT